MSDESTSVDENATSYADFRTTAIEYRKYSHANGRRFVVNYTPDLPLMEFDESQTDPSFAHPASALAQGLKTSAAYGALAKQFYDFNDGKDDGSAMPISRQKGVDLAEISQDVARRRADVESEQKALSDAQSAKENAVKQFQEFQQAVNSSSDAQGGA